MKNVFFEPFVGEQYDKGYLGKKILVLGDSHYCGDDRKAQCVQAGDCLKLPECHDFTSRVLRYFFEYKEGVSGHQMWMNTYNRFTNVFLVEKGGKVNYEQFMDFWNSIMFYNYVQVPMDGSRKEPTQKEYEDSQDAFFEVLEEYKPDLIDIWGWRLLGKLPKKNKSAADFKSLNASNSEHYCYFEVAGKKILAYAHPHPSANFGYEYHSKLQEAVRLA